MAKVKTVSVHDMQTYASSGVTLHPHLAQAYAEAIYQLSTKGYISLMPITILERFNDKLEAQQKSVAKRKVASR